MIYRDFKGIKLSMLGFGAMRLPLLENGQIDTEQNPRGNIRRIIPRQCCGPV